MVSGSVLRGADKGVIVSGVALLEIGFTFNKRRIELGAFKRHGTALKLPFPLLQAF